MVQSRLGHQQTLDLVSLPSAIKMRIVVVSAFMELYGLAQGSANYDPIQSAVCFCVACNPYF